jgi:site-specific recombinase XerD
MLELLRRRGVTLEKRQPPLSLKEKVVAEFRRYLLKERGLSAKTAFGYGPFINRFLSETFRDGRLSFAHLRAPDVTDFVRRHAYNAGRAYARHLVQALRSFLRYLRLQGKIKTDLEGCVLSVAAWSLASLPKFIPAEAVEKVLASCDRDTANGKRNHAILLLLARLGLRAGEVIHLNLDDIDWDNGTITFHAKGNRQSRMPLPAEVGEALALYLQVRRHCACRRVFLCDGAPVRGFSNSNGISTLVRRALERAKVEAAHTGAHLFRHSLATEMLRKNASLDEIGEVLRHKSPDTTAIYAKVDIAALRRLALPWPGGAR